MGLGRTFWFRGPIEPFGGFDRTIFGESLISGAIFWGKGSGGVKSAGVSQSVRETSRDESPNVLSTQKLFKTRDLELPNV